MIFFFSPDLYYVKKNIVVVCGFCCCFRQNFQLSENWHKGKSNTRNVVCRSRGILSYPSSTELRYACF